MKNKIAFVLSVLILAFALTGCGNNTQEPAEQPVTESTAQASDSETTASESDDANNEDSPSKSSEEVSVVFSNTTITLTYRGYPATDFYNTLDNGSYSYVKLFFTYEERTMNNAGVFCFETEGDGEVSALAQFGDFKLKDAEVTFGENGFPLTCVFTGSEEDIAGIRAEVDMKGKVQVTDSRYNNNIIADVKDVIVEQ